MADVINLADRRKKELPPPVDVLRNAVDHIAADWERFAKTNRLNDYFVEAASVWTDGATNYLSDLNAISLIEHKLGYGVLVKSPAFTQGLGWKASFRLKSGTATTPDMPFETYARCFGILLYIKRKRDLVAMGYTEEL